VIVVDVVAVVVVFFWKGIIDEILVLGSQICEM
jgi:hypothetical protein